MCANCTRLEHKLIQLEALRVSETYITKIK
jgi:hypothetical protein